MSKYAVVILNLGGPDSLKAVQPFLYNLFSDPDIFKIPFGQKFFARVISKRRAPVVESEYEMIGGKSPISYWTEHQRKNLEIELRKEIENIDVITAMRYWYPLIKDVAAEFKHDEYDKIILLPLYPHYSISTTGSSFNEWKRYYNGEESKIIYINDYFKDDKYIEAVNDRINESISRLPEGFKENLQLVFSAHGTPVSMVKKGDPYSIQIKETVDAIMKLRNYDYAHHLCYQSKVGPVKWLEPSTEDTIEKLAKENKKSMLVIPISFVSDHVETSYELDIEYREVAQKCNVKNYVVMKGLNDSLIFIDALKSLTLNAIKNQ
ncbi:MAG: ferrochelatase [Ignavibacteria bacterium]